MFRRCCGAGYGLGFTIVLLVACGGRSERDSDTAPPTSAEPTPEPVEGGSCRSNADCAVAAPCCGPCGALKAEDAVAVLRAEAPAFREACSASTELPCAECFRESNPYLVPVCRQGSCRVLDLSQQPATACETGTDCTLRASVCCGKDSAVFISVNAAELAELDELLCDGEPAPVSCRTEPPMHQGAVCRESRCSSAFFSP